MEAACGRPPGTAVVSSQGGRFFWRKLEWELTATWVLPEAFESSPLFWEAPLAEDVVDSIS